MIYEPEPEPTPDDDLPEDFDEQNEADEWAALYPEEFDDDDSDPDDG